MRTVVLDYYLDEATKIFGAPRKAVDQEKLRTRFENQNYAGVMGGIKTSLEINLPMKIGWLRKPMPKVQVPVTLEGPDVRRPEAAFVPQVILMHKEAIRYISFEMLVITFVHVLTHLLLSQKQSTLVDDPAGVDVTAMLLGFREFYIKESAYSRIQMPTAENPVGHLGTLTITGGLTQKEAEYVAKKLGV